MQNITEQPTKTSEAPDGLSADALRAEAWAGEPFLREGEDPARVLAPGTSRRRALDDAIAEIDGGQRTPTSDWKVRYGLMLGLERVLAEEKPHLASGTELRRHQVDALAGMLTELIAANERPEEPPNGNGNGAEPVDEEEEEPAEDSTEDVLDLVVEDVLGRVLGRLLLFLVDRFGAVAVAVRRLFRTLVRRNQLGEHARERVDLVAPQLGARGEVRFLFCEDALEPQHQPVAHLPVGRGRALSSIDLGDGVVKCAPARCAGREHSGGIFALPEEKAHPPRLRLGGRRPKGRPAPPTFWSAAL